MVSNFLPMSPLHSRATKSSRFAVGYRQYTHYIYIYIYFNTLSSGSGLVAAVSLCVKRENILCASAK